MSTADLQQLDAEQTDGPDEEAFHGLLARLSRQSVDKHFDAYADVPWDDPEYRLDPSDPRWARCVDEGLADTAWCQELPIDRQARLGLDLVASRMKIGLQFENVLKRGLLEFANTLPNQAPEFRYVYHEVIEEAQHSLMFHEFVNRSRFDAAGLGRLERFATRFIVGLGRRFPSLFFVFVLGGEDPIDYVQRRELRRSSEGQPLHPLLERIMRIHVTEEARHLSFARHYLKHKVPKLGRLRRLDLSIEAPIILAIMAQLMLKPSPQIVRRYGIPRSARRQAYRRDPRNRTEMLASLGKVRRLCGELGLITPVTRQLWRTLGVWE